MQEVRERRWELGRQDPITPGIRDVVDNVVIGKQDAGHTFLVDYLFVKTEDYLFTRENFTLIETGISNERSKYDQLCLWCDNFCLN